MLLFHSECFESRKGHFLPARFIIHVAIRWLADMLPMIRISLIFNQKVGQAEKRARFTLSTNHQQIVIRQTLFPSPTFQVARFRINTSRTFGGSSCKKKDRLIPMRSSLLCQVNYYFSLSSIVQMLTRFQSGSENMSPTPLPWASMRLALMR